MNDLARAISTITSSGTPVLLRIDYEAGHFGTTKKQAYEERADTFAFLFARRASSRSRGSSDAVCTKPPLRLVSSPFHPTQ